MKNKNVKTFKTTQKGNYVSVDNTGCFSLCFLNDIARLLESFKHISNRLKLTDEHKSVRKSARYACSIIGDCSVQSQPRSQGLSGAGR